VIDEKVIRVLEEALNLFGWEYFDSVIGTGLREETSVIPGLHEDFLHAAEIIAYRVGGCEEWCQKCDSAQCWAVSILVL
jgi:hypothetical protein